MWRTCGGLLVLLALTVNAAPATDEKFVAGIAPLGQQEPQLEAIPPNDDSFVVGIAPLKVKENNKLEQENTIKVGVAPFRVHRSSDGENSGIISSIARSLVRNRLDGEKKVITIETTNSIASIKFGKKQPFPINALITFSTDDAYVYSVNTCKGKDSCRADPAPTAFYDEKVDAINPTSTYINDYTQAISVYSNQIDVGTAYTGKFGVVTGWTNKAKNNPSLQDAVLGLGLDNNNGRYNNLQALLGLVTDKTILITHDKDVTTTKGKIVIGAATADGCLPRTTAYQNANNTDDKLRQWWFNGVTLTTKNTDKKPVTQDKYSAGIDPTSPYVSVPQKFYDALVQFTDNKDGGAITKLDNLPDLEFKFGDENLKLTPPEYTSKVGDKYSLMVRVSNQADIMFGRPFIRKYCVVLNGADDKYPQIAFLVDKNSAMAKFSWLGLVLVPLVQMFVR